MKRNSFQTAMRTFRKVAAGFLAISRRASTTGTVRLPADRAGVRAGKRVVGVRLRRHRPVGAWRVEREGFIKTYGATMPREAASW